MGQVALAGQAAARRHEVGDALVAAERGLDGELARRVGAQAHRGQHVQAFDIAFGMAFFAGHHHPAGTVAAGTVVFRQAVQGDEQHVVGQRGERDVLVAVIQSLVVDLVSVDDQLVLARQFDDLEQHLA